MDHSDPDLVKQQAFDQQQRQFDSQDSSWSEIQKPGSSYLDRLIKERDRFNLHYHKEDIVNIPETNRIPLLPDEENYDWIEERKLMSIQASGGGSKKMGTFYNRRLADKQHELETKDPELTNLFDHWTNMSKNEKDQLRNKQSLSVLERASKINGKKQTIGDFTADRFWDKGIQFTRKQQGRPSKEFIKLQFKSKCANIFKDLAEEQIQIDDMLSQQEDNNSYSFGKKRQQ